MGGHMEGWIGRILADRYRIDALLGVAETGVIFAAADLGGDRVSIKVLDPNLAAAGLAAEFVRDSRDADGVRCAAFPRLLHVDVDAEQSTSFLVCEPARGLPLAY